ncbi:3-(3-hydroxyphenyl)propionate hydroxylase [Lentzea pudingi]|uniref:3-(3-hydroxyphenyl)propionate hydroxylase n=1 Tax=Lentzea pudingi TaxID=1789439 RepID=A0ABQ2ILV3_9PSEU|nr:FAD-dependent oxidoreductase [Lentzea pudingi]GGN18865.1 3-(3-hydroxyphenyl)propionate hydroxylase [Lentzea pudingi]
MGLLVFALVTLLFLLTRRMWGRLTGTPLPQVTARPGSGFLAGLGKSRTRPEPTVAPPKTIGARAARHDCDVLVVGAGPSGLMTAALLVRQGIKVCVVDANAGPATESRAFAVQARTIELFRSIGLADELLGRGVVTTGIRFHIKGRHVGGLDFDRAKAATTPYQFILMAPQSEVEEVLLHDLARHGVTVRRDTRLTRLRQTDDAVTAVVGERTITAQYVVGADGAHSTVRQQLGLTFDGDKYGQRYLLADCKVEWPLDHAHFRVFMNRDRIGLFLPLRGAETSRVMVTDFGDPQTEFDLGALQTELRRAMNLDVTLSAPIWTSRYQVHLRGVDDYRRGRGFLVGDAAHIHSPAGGQGMNTGLHDAANLAWKLAAAITEGVDLLGTYSAERHPAGVRLLKFTDRLYRVAAGLRGWRAWLRDTAGPFLVGRMSAAPIPHRKSFHRLSQISLGYRPSEINVNELLYSLKGPLAGQRVPDARINDREQVFDLLQGYQLHVIALSRKHLTADEITATTTRLQELGVTGHLIGRVEARQDDRVHRADSPQVFEHYGLTEPDSRALYVIRPDGHVAWRCDELDFEACQRFLTRLHRPTTRQVQAG